MPRDLLAQPRDLLAGPAPSEGLKEIGSAPELNKFSVPAFKASMGLLTTGDDASLRGILTEQLGESVSFSDSDGGTVVNLPSGQYLLNKKGVSPQDVARFVFDAAAYTPAGRAGTIVRAIGKNAATEGVIEGAETALGGDFSGSDVALAGGLGGALKGAEGLVSAAVRGYGKGTADDVVDAGAAAGIPVFTSDVRAPQTFASRHLVDTAEKIPLVGTGGNRAQQQAARAESLDDFLASYASPNYTAIIDSLKTQKDRLKKAAGSALQSAGTKLDEVGEVPLTRTMQAIEKAKAQLSKPGVLGGADETAELQTLVDTLGEAPQSFTMLKENSTAFREIVDRLDSADRSQLTSRGKALMTDVQRSIRGDMDDFARQNLSPREYRQWKRANVVYRDEAIKLKKSRLKTVLDKGDITPERANDLLFSAKPSEVRNIYGSLTNEGRSNARAAVIGKMVSDLSKRQSGLTPNSFATEAKKYSTQIDVLFKGEEKRALNGLIKALGATRRAQDAAVTTPTGQVLTGGITGISIYIDPLSTLGAAGTIGGLGRLYESAPVRNALLRLDSVPRGSTRFDQALAEFQTALNASAQAAKPEGEAQ